MKKNTIRGGQWRWWFKQPFFRHKLFLLSGILVFLLVTFGIILQRRGAVRYHHHKLVSMSSSSTTLQKKEEHPFHYLLSSKEQQKETPIFVHRIANTFRHEAVVKAINHSWQAYKKCAWGFDELNPVSCTGENWYGSWTPLGFMIVDSLDTLYLAGLDVELADALQWVELHFPSILSRYRLVHVSFFEVVIRLLGGLLSAYQILPEKTYKNKEFLLNNAKQLADQLIESAFDHESRAFPRPYVPLSLTFPERLARYMGWSSDIESVSITVPGSLQLEFLTLSRLTKDPKYFRIAKNITKQFIETCSGSSRSTSSFPDCCVGWDKNGKCKDVRPPRLGSLGDSFYEYVIKLKVMIQPGDFDTAEEFLTFQSGLTQLWTRLHQGVVQRSVEQVMPPSLGQSPDDERLYLFPNHAAFPVYFQTLACFSAGMFALSGWHYCHQEPPGQNLDDPMQYRRKNMIAGRNHLPIDVQERLLAEDVAKQEKEKQSKFDHHDDNEKEEEILHDSAPMSFAREIMRMCDAIRTRYNSGLPQEKIGFSSKNSRKKKKSSEKIASSFADPNDDYAYRLRPEVVESYYYLLMTSSLKEKGAQREEDHAWELFVKIVTQLYCPESGGFSGAVDVRMIQKMDAGGGRRFLNDKMETFWVAETLKYFLLMFSRHDGGDGNRVVVEKEYPSSISSVDATPTSTAFGRSRDRCARLNSGFGRDWVFNTEAHPMMQVAPHSKRTAFVNKVETDFICRQHHP